jgi:hypothetical protein
MQFKCDDGSGGTTEYFSLDGGHVRLNAKVNLRIYDAKKLELGNSGDLQIYHNNSNDRGYIYNGTGDLYIENDATDGDIKFYSDDGSGGTAQYFRVDGGAVETQFLKSTLHYDNVKAKFGDSSDLQIYHDGSNSYIQDTTGTGELIIDTSTFRVRSANGGENMIRAFEDGAVVLSYNQFDKLQTTNTGVSVTGNANFADDGKAIFGTGSDLQIYHDGSDSYVSQVGTGNLIIQNTTDDADIIFKSDDSTGGVTEYFKVDGTNHRVKFSKDSAHMDSVKALFGDSLDLQIYHDGNNSYISDTGTGDLYIQASDNMYFQTYGSGKRWITLTENAAVDLFYNDSKKFETTSAGVAVTGELTVSTISNATADPDKFLCANGTGS